MTGDFFSLLAHISKDEDREVSQYLAEHLVDTALYAESRGKELGVGNICALIGLLHDAGKSLSEFQEYIQGKRDSGGDHSSYGGYCLLTIKDRLVQSAQFKDVKGLEDYCDLLTYPILAHHGLYDILDNNCYRTESRIRHVKLQLEKQVDGLNLEECLDGLNQLSKKAWGKNLSQLFLLGYNEYKVWNQRIKDIAAETSPQRKKSCTDFFMGATVRLLLSILKEADIYNSSNWNRHDVNPILKKSQVDMIWEKMHSRIEKLYEGYASHAGDSTINKVRSELANEVLQSAKRTPYGCYVLDLPVGAGKTMSSLRYAVEHARIHGNQRIFYVTAYLSVLEQNAREIQDVIGEEHVLEHHSNVVEDTQEMSEEEYSLKSYLRDSWESPVVLTTLVQFTNTLFKGKSSNLRRFCKFANSVIIIDEIQSLPIKTVYLMNLMTNFLTRFMNVTVIHCTATLPSLDNKNVLLFPCLYGTKHAEAKLVSKEWSQHSVFSRVNFHSLLGKHFSDSVDTSEILLFLRNQLSFYKSFLIILNTKSAVGTLYKALQEEYSDTADLYYLTTNLCAAHRLERIDNLKRALRALRKGQREKPLICVSTNLISAGVNIDIRSFGQVITYQKRSIGIRGPVSISLGRSLDPVTAVTMQITRSTNGMRATKEGGRSSDTMGSKNLIKFGVYKVCGSMNCYFSEKTGFNDEDANAIKEALLSLFENDLSSARPEGSMNVEKIYWFTHPDKLGVASSAKIHDLVKSKKRVEGEARSFTDYIVSVDADRMASYKAKGLQLEILEGK